MSVSLLPAFSPNSSARHQYLSGIEVTQSTLTTTTTLPSFGYQTFRLPRDFTRETDIPDITGVQVCANTLTNFSANISLEVNEFGSWTLLTKGSVVGAPVGDTQEWVTVYFNEPVSLPTRWLTRQFRLGVQTDSAVWYATPAVLIGETATIGTAGNLAFKLLCNTADSGTDFLSNRYRSMVKRQKVDNTNTKATATPNSFWYSKPNPSKYAVESLYFDIREGNNLATVTDRLLVDPITPGAYFTLYYSSDGGTVKTQAEWERKLWTPVYQTFKMDRREEHALPEPISAKFVKIEFSHLQAQHYSPGTFSQPIIYKKHPKWVLDYFLARLNAENFSDDPYIARRVRVIYNALKIGYDYYLDDLHQDPAAPDILNTTALQGFLSDRADVSDQIDASTFTQIQTEIAPYTQQPGARVDSLGYLLSTYRINNLDDGYPIERKNPAIADTTQVSTLDRQNLVVEQNYPVMFFYLPCRHTYRELQASFENDRAYFVGVRELAFMRDHYTVASDTPTYIENLTDFTNARRNDFVEQVVDDA